MTARKLYICPQCSISFYRLSSQVRPGVENPSCSAKCRTDSRRARSPKHPYRGTQDPNHPLATKGGRVREHRRKLYDKIGPGVHSCTHCGVDVEWIVGRSGGGHGSLVTDHLNGNPFDDSLENLVPACQKCNANRGRLNFVRDDELYILSESRGESYRARAVEKECNFCGVKFLRKIASDKLSTSSFCSRSCGAKGRRRKEKAACSEENAASIV